MANPIPLIRALSMLPAIRWMVANEHPIDEVLRKVRLSAVPFTDPMRPVPLVHVVTLLREISDRYGPDTPCRIVSEANILEIALLGKVALGTASPREALTRIAAALPLFCSHEQVSLNIENDASVVRQFYTQRFDVRAEHYVHQYVAAMLDRLCSMTGTPFPRLKRVEMRPHPDIGLKHLEPWFGDQLIEARSRTVSVWVDSELMDRPFRTIARDRMAGRRPPDILPLRGDGTLGSSARLVLLTMIKEGQAPTVKSLAAAAGRSVRTLQRQLESEGFTFSDLLEEVRREETLKQLAASDLSIASISADVGYADHASFTRAFRRWMGEPPRTFRTRVSG